LKPTETEDFDYINNLDFDANGNLRDSTYPIDQQRSFLIIVGNCAAPAGCLGLYTVACGIEYLTSDTWRETEKAVVDHLIYDNAINIMKDLVQFHENPLHLSDLWKGIKTTVGKVVKGVVDYGLPIAKMVKTVAGLIM